MKRRRKVDRDDRVPFFRREFFDRGDMLDAGIIDQDIQAAERLLMLGYHRDDLVRLAHICGRIARSEEHTSELQSLMRISYAVFCLKKKKIKNQKKIQMIDYYTNINLP